MAFSADPPSLPPDDQSLPLPESTHQPGDEHCGVGGEPKPGHPYYRQCRCGLWYHWTGTKWRPRRPSKKWLRKHGLGQDAAGFLVSAPFLDSEPQIKQNFPFGEFTLAGGLRYRLRSLRYRLRSLLRR